MNDPRRVLLIEDDLDDIQIFCMILTELYPGVNIVSHQHSDIALKNLAQGNVSMPDYIFLDLNMPKMDGWECLTFIKQIPMYRNVPVIMYTTSNKEEDMSHALNLGASHFLTKSFTVEDMRNTLKQFFSHNLEASK
jgi:CheY-like chemotaxis protein